MKLWMESLFNCLCGLDLLVIAIRDEKAMEIPPACNLLLGALGIGRIWCNPFAWQEHLAGFFAVSILLFVGFWLTGGEKIGGGDVKLMAAAGLFLGWEGILWAFFLGGTLSLAGFLFRREGGREEKRMALGPYLAAGILTVMLIQETIY